MACHTHPPVGGRGDVGRAGGRPAVPGSSGRGAGGVGEAGVGFQHAGGPQGEFPLTHF